MRNCSILNKTVQWIGYLCQSTVSGNSTLGAKTLIGNLPNIQCSDTEKLHFFIQDRRSALTFTRNNDKKKGGRSSVPYIRLTIRSSVLHITHRCTVFRFEFKVIYLSILETDAIVEHLQGFSIFTITHSKTPVGWQPTNRWQPLIVCRLQQLAQYEVALWYVLNLECIHVSCVYYLPPKDQLFDRS